MTTATPARNSGFSPRANPIAPPARTAANLPRISRASSRSWSSGLVQQVGREAREVSFELDVRAPSGSSNRLFRDAELHGDLGKGARRPGQVSHPPALLRAVREERVERDQVCQPDMSYLSEVSLLGLTKAET